MHVNGFLFTRASLKELAVHVPSIPRAEPSYVLQLQAVELLVRDSVESSVQTDVIMLYIISVSIPMNSPVPRPLR